MFAIRRRLSWVAAAWLCCQVAGLATAPALVAIGIDQDTCCPGVGPGQACPMHHRSDSADRTCKMRSACQAPDAALISMVGGIGVLSRPPDVVAVPAISRPISAAAVPPISRSARPESPPPRS